MFQASTTVKKQEKTGAESKGFGSRALRLPALVLIKIEKSGIFRVNDLSKIPFKLDSTEPSEGNLNLDWGKFIFWFSILIASYVVQSQNFLLFHVSVELFRVVIAYSLFILAWNTLAYQENSYFSFIGIAFFFVGTLDLVHTMAYRGMGILPGQDANPATQLWIAARWVEALSFLAAPALITRTLNPYRLFIGFSVITVGLLSAIVWGVFPVCYQEGSGLTAFKVVSEYAVSIIFLVSAGLLRKNSSLFEKDLYYCLVFSILSSVLAELAFTFYISVSGLSNVIGHFLKLISCYFIYKAVVESGLARPVRLLFRNLKSKEKQQEELIEKLTLALSEIKTLRGIVPICANCKKIRNDEGFWQQVENYVELHTEAAFSHGICPDCRKKLYPEFTPDDTDE